MSVLHNRYPSQGQFMEGHYDMSTIEFKSEGKRLRTFRNWPFIFSNPRPAELAEAGWFYTGIEDRVKCPFCSGILNNWKPTDNPFQEHYRHFPSCSFIRGLDVGNIPISRNFGSPGFVNFPQGNAVFPQREDVLRRPVVCNDNRFEERVGDFGIANRLNTFSGWPLQTSQKPEDLANAGFFHDPSEEKPDRVKCAFCHLKLFNWQFMDDPWVEHAKCNPGCEFIRRIMGEDVVRDLANSQERISRATASQEAAISTPGAASDIPQSRIQVKNHKHLPEPSSAAPSESPVQSSSSSSSSNESPSSSLREYMQSYQVMAVLEMGFPEHLVRKAVEECVRNKPGNLPSAENLGSIVMAMEEQQSTTAAVATSLTPLQRLKALQSGSYHPPQAASVELADSERLDPALSGLPSIANQYLEASGEGTIRNRDSVSPRLQEGTIRDRDNSSPTHLSQRTTELREENDRLKDKFLCKICMEEKVSVTFMPCGHLACCPNCSMAVRICPICRSPIEGRLKTIY